MDLAEFLYESCAGQYPDHDPLTGAQMLATIQMFYPSVTHFEHGTIHLYPNHSRIQGLEVEEYEADAFRDSARHWMAIEAMLNRTDAKELPSMDLYALEELSEFLSVFGVAYVKLSGQVLRNLDSQGSRIVDRRAFKSARHLFVLASEDHVKTQRCEQKALPITGDANHVSEINPPTRVKVIDSLNQSFIEDPFSDVTAATGIRFRHESSQLVEQHRFATQGKRPQDIPGYFSRAKHQRAHGYKSSVPNHSLGIEGGGVAVGDVDGDGLLDVYLVSGASSRLFRNRGDLRFADVTESSHLEDNAEGRGAYFVDYDNDDDQDLFITQVYAPNRLFQNQGDGRFIDVTEKAGLPLRHDLVSHSAVWFDFDNDGFLDVYVGNYGDWLGDELHPRASRFQKRPAQPTLSKQWARRV